MDRAQGVSVLCLYFTVQYSVFFPWQTDNREPNIQAFLRIKHIEKNEKNPAREPKSANLPVSVTTRFYSFSKLFLSACFDISLREGEAPCSLPPKII